MSLIKELKIKRKLLSVIALKLNKVHYFFRRIIGMHIFDVTYQISAAKGDKCQKHCNNCLLKYAMSNNETYPTLKKFKPKNIYKSKIYKKIAVFEKYAHPISRKVFRFRRK